MGAKIKSMREAVGLSVGDLAKTAGVDEAALTAFEDGRGELSSGDLEKLAAAIQAAKKPGDKPAPDKAPQQPPPANAKEARAQEQAVFHPRDLTGAEWEIVVLKAGRASNANRFDYPDDVLARDFRAFEGVPIRVSWDGLDHHDTVGNVRAVEARKLDGRMAIVGRAHVTDAKARERMLRAYRAGDPYEFSIDTPVRGRESTDGYVVTEIKSPAEELTIVRRGAAGGRVLRAVAGKESTGMSEVIEQELARARQAREAAEAAQKTIQEAAATIQRQAKEATFKALLSQQLAGSRLPPQAQTRVEELLRGRSDEGEAAKKAITDAIEGERAYVRAIAGLSGGPAIAGCGATVEVGTEKHDRVLAAVDGLFARRDMPIRARESGGKATGPKVERFKSIKRMVRELTGREMSVDEIVREMFYGGQDNARARESLTTTGLGNVILDAMRKRMLDGWSMDDRIALLKRICGRNWGTSLEDFRTVNRMRFGGYGLLPTVAQSGTYQPLTSPEDEKVTFTPAKKGGTEDATMEAIANDDAGVLARIPDELRLAAVETLYQAILDIFVNNSTIYDSSAIFRSGNKTSSAFSKSELNTARQAMRSQTRPKDTTKVLGSRNLPKIWLGPNELEETALILAGSRVVVGATNQAATEEPNLHRGLEVLVVDYWTDAADCLVMADPMECDTIEVGFYQGREVPEIFVQDMVNVGSMFNADKITYKVRHIHGHAVLDYRPFYGFSRA
jgi:transcriptional regulator with XRE-family HTH domain